MHFWFKYGRRPRISPGLVLIRFVIFLSRGDIKPATIILVTGTTNEPEKFTILSKLLENAAIQIFVVSYPSTSFPGITGLSKFGQHYSVSDDDLVHDPLKISGQLSRIFLDIISRVENVPHHQVYVKVDRFVVKRKNYSLYKEVAFGYCSDVISYLQRMYLGT